MGWIRLYKKRLVKYLNTKTKEWTTTDEKDGCCSRLFRSESKVVVDIKEDPVVESDFVVGGQDGTTKLNSSTFYRLEVEVTSGGRDAVTRRLQNSSKLEIDFKPGKALGSPWQLLPLKDSRNNKAVKKLPVKTLSRLPQQKKPTVM